MRKYWRSTLSGFLKLQGIVFSLVILASCGSSRRTISIEEGWDLLGEQKVNFIKETDEIEFHADKRYTALRFKVEEREIRLTDLRIIFTNGDKLEPNVDVTVPPNQYSRDIELSAEGRYISKVAFTYRTTGNMLKGRAKVLIFGKRYDSRYDY